MSGDNTVNRIFGIWINDASIFVDQVEAVAMGTKSVGIEVVNNGTATIRNSRMVGDMNSINALSPNVVGIDSQFEGPRGGNVFPCHSCIDENLDAIGALGTDFLADGSVDTDQLADDAVTGDKIDSETITSDNIVDGTVDLGDLDTGNVDTRYVNQDGDTMGGDLDMDSNNITNAGFVTATTFNGTASDAALLDGIDSSRFVQILPGAAQQITNVDTSLIHVNYNFGTASNIVELQKGGGEVFVVDTGGNVTANTFTAGFSGGMTTDYRDGIIATLSGLAITTVGGGNVSIDVGGGDSPVEDFLVTANNFSIDGSGDVTANSFTAGNSSTVLADGSLTTSGILAIDVASGNGDFSLNASNIVIDDSGDIGPVGLVDGVDVSDHAGDGSAHFVRTVVVSLVGSDTANGTAFLAALAGITDSGASKPHLLKIEPGIYDLGTGTLSMKDYVDIEGSGIGITIITGSNSGTGTTIANSTASNSELRFLTVSNTGGGRALFIDSTSPSIFKVELFSDLANGTPVAVTVANSGDPVFCKVTVSASGDGPIAVEVDGSTATFQNSDIDAQGDGGGSNPAIGVLLNSTGFANLNDVFITVTDGGSANNGVFISEGAVTLRDSDIDVPDMNGIGVKCDDGSANIFGSRIQGGSAALDVDSNGNANVATSLVSGTVNPGLGLATLVHCFDEDFIAINDGDYGGA